MKILNKPKIKKAASFFMLFLMLIYSTECNYYKVKYKTAQDLPSIHDIGQIYKVMILHAGKHVYFLRDIQVDSASISGKIEETNPDIFFYHERTRGSDYAFSRRYKSEQKDILNEVHFYLNRTELDTATTKIALKDIQEIHIIEKATGKTAASYVFGAIGITAGVFVIVGVIALLTKSSCPYVYVNDGGGYVFEGETFGGAIAPNLERDDYMPLPDIQTTGNPYKIRISNELLEKQYTDVAELMVVNHPKNQKVLLDKNGQPQSITNTVNPISATSSNGNNLLSVLQKKDANVFFFNDQNYSQNSITLKFKKPINTTTGKLVLNGKNTLWFDYLFGEFIGKFGASYNRWMEQQAKMPSAERLEKIKENEFPLSVYIKKNGKWVFADNLLTVGPLASRDFVIPVELSDIQGDEIEVKIETGFMFWEMDYAGMDFTSNQKLSIDILKPTVAAGTGHKDWTAALKEADKNYMAQDSVGQVTEITYPSVKHNDEQAQTVFLHTRGYYTLIRHFEGLPNIVELNKFKTPGYFSGFSRMKYLKAMDKEENLAIVPKTPLKQK